MSDPDGIYVLAGDEPTLWVYPSAVHAGGDAVTGLVSGAGSVSYTLHVDLARGVTGEGTASGTAVRPGGTVGGGGNTYPTRLRPWERDDWPPEEEPDDQEERDLEALIVLGAL